MKARKLLKKVKIWKKLPKQWRDEAVAYLHHALRESEMLAKASRMAQGVALGTGIYAAMVTAMKLCVTCL